jgi:hypothetical protein
MSMLFGGYPDPPPAEPQPKVSADRRRTLRQRADIDHGIHPLIKLALANNGHTCGDCAHRVLAGYHRRSYPKCEEVRWTHGAGSDCRAWWPACTKWEPQP